MSGQHGSSIGGWSLKAVGVRGIGPVLDVEHQALLLFFELAIAGDCGEGTELFPQGARGGPHKPGQSPALRGEKEGTA